MFGKRKSANLKYNSDQRNEEEIVRSDFLFIKSGPFSINRKKYFKLFRKSAKENSRLEIYASKEASVSNFPENVLVSADAIRIGFHQTDRLGIVIVFKESTIILITDSKESRENWIKALRETFFGGEDIETCTEKKEHFIESHDNEQTFVTAWASNDISLEYGKSELFLSVFDCYLILYNTNRKEIEQWSIKSIRSFGFQHSEFHFETGRKSKNGPKYYSFKLNKNEDKSLKKMLENERQTIRSNSLSIEQNNMSNISFIEKNVELPVPLTRLSNSIIKQHEHSYDGLTNNLDQEVSSSKIGEDDIFEGKKLEEDLYFPSVLLHLKNRDLSEISGQEIQSDIEDKSNITYSFERANEKGQASSIGQEDLTVKEDITEKAESDDHLHQLLPQDTIISHYKGQLDGVLYAIAERPSTPILLEDICQNVIK